MTSKELREFVRLQLSEENESFYLNANIDNYLKRAINRFVNKTHVAIEKQTIVYVKGTGLYNLNFLPLKMRSIVLVPTTDPRDVERTFIPIAFEDFKRTSEAVRLNQRICFIDIRAKTIELSKDFENGNLFLEFHTKSNDAVALSMIDNTIIPDEYHETIADYAIYLAYLKDKEAALANSFLAKYLETEREAVKEVQEREVSPANNDFSSEIINPHREDRNFQDITVI